MCGVSHLRGDVLEIDCSNYFTFLTRNSSSIFLAPFNPLIKCGSLSPTLIFQIIINIINNTRPKPTNSYITISKFGCLSPSRSRNCKTSGNSPLAGPQAPCDPPPSPLSPSNPAHTPGKTHRAGPSHSRGSTPPTLSPTTSPGSSTCQGKAPRRQNHRCRATHELLQSSEFVCTPSTIPFGKYCS